MGLFSSPNVPNKYPSLVTGWRRKVVIAIPYLFLILFFSVPFLVIMRLSVSVLDGIHYKNLFEWSNNTLSLTLNLGNYLFLLTDDLYAQTYWLSIKTAFITALICLLIGYPFAYFMARAKATWRPALLMMVMLPFWTSYLLRVYAWKLILDKHGLINNTLIMLHIIDVPLKMIYTRFSMTLGMVYTYLPFMILPIYANLVKMDLALLDAAADLGTRPFKTFWLVTVPLSKAGIIAGSMLVFIPALGEYVTPELLGGPGSQMIGRTLWNEFFDNNDWAMACAVGVAMIALILVPMVIFNKYQNQSASGKSGLT